MKKRYGKAYFDKWYRDPRHRVTTPAELARKVGMVVSIAEYVLGRPIRSVLDVGCGEGTWYSILRRLRPAVRYTGVDPSPYVVRRFGGRRHIRLGSLQALDRHGWIRTFDLIVCCDVLNYLPPSHLAPGLSHVSRLLGGVAYLEIYTGRDRVTGDVGGWRARSPSFYQRLLRNAGLTRCGPHCYIPPELARHTAVLERDLHWRAAG